MIDKIFYDVKHQTISISDGVGITKCKDYQQARRWIDGKYCFFCKTYENERNHEGCGNNCRIKQ